MLPGLLFVVVCADMTRRQQTAESQVLASGAVVRNSLDAGVDVGEPPDVSFLTATRINASDLHDKMLVEGHFLRSRDTRIQPYTYKWSMSRVQYGWFLESTRKALSSVYCLKRSGDEFCLAEMTHTGTEWSVAMVDRASSTRTPFATFTLKTHNAISDRFRALASTDTRAPHELLNIELEADSSVKLEQMQAKWNSAVEAYVLNFGGRVTYASEKNFVLTRAGESDTYVRFGRHPEFASGADWSGRDDFILDCKMPAPPLLAFAVAVAMCEA